MEHDDPMRVGDEDFDGYGHDWQDREEAYLNDMDRDEQPRSLLVDVFKSFNEIFGRPV